MSNMTLGQFVLCVIGFVYVAFGFMYSFEGRFDRATFDIAVAGVFFVLGTRSVR